jgi:hypothetical protein
MLSEEALIVLAAFGACALLILGVLELLWPTRPKHVAPRRKPIASRVVRPHRQSALVRHTRDRSRIPHGRRPELFTPAPVPLDPLARSVRPDAATAAATLLDEAPPAAMAETLRDVAPVTARRPLPGPPSTLEPAAVAMPSLATMRASSTDVGPLAAVGVAAVDTPVENESLVDRCFALYQARRYSDVVERAAAALSAPPDGRSLAEAKEHAALWSVVALAHQGLGEDARARVALERAIATAPEGDRRTYKRQLASLAESVARGLLAEAERHARLDSEKCLATIRSAVAWLDRGAVEAPDDAELVELAAGAQARLWPAWQRTVMALVQRQEFRAARRLLREALADPRFPAARAATFEELFSGTFSGEIGQLTAQAIRSMQEARESDALASLQRAETLLDTLNDEALPPARRQEVDRRLWWGYSKLGARRIEAGDPEAALEPLFHALGYEVGPARREETAALLVRALDGVTDVRTLAVRELSDAGDREAALVQCDTLRGLLRSATEMGLGQGELAATFAKVQRVFETLSRSR